MQQLRAKLTAHKRPKIAGEYGEVQLATSRTLKYHTKTFTMHTLLDLVGWIISVASPVPSTAKRDNYYYPLCGLYAYFCRTLIGSKKREPKMIQLTFFQHGTTKRVVLGANLDNLRSDVKTKFQEERKKQMDDAGLSVQPNVKQPSNSAPQLLGHCAETFSFMFAKSCGP